MSHLLWFQGLWVLLHHQYWAFPVAPLGQPVAVLYHGNPATLGLYCCHMLQLVIGVNDGMGQLIVLVQGLSGCWVIEPASSSSF